MFPQGGIAPVARAQLAAWEEIAMDWALVTAPGEHHARCHSCGQSVIRLFDDRENIYEYSAEQRLALTVAHLRQVHPDLDPDR